MSHFSLSRVKLTIVFRFITIFFIDSTLSSFTISQHYEWFVVPILHIFNYFHLVEWFNLKLLLQVIPHRWESKSNE